MRHKWPRGLRNTIPSKAGRRWRRGGEVGGEEGQREVNRWVSKIHQLGGNQHHSHSTPIKKGQEKKKYQAEKRHAGLSTADHPSQNRSEHGNPTWKPARISGR